MNLTKAQIAGFGACVGKRRVSNDFFEQTLETNDEWIQTRTGIQQRHFVENETLADLSYVALKEALESNNSDGSDIDVVLVATTTPDAAFPSCAATLHGRLKLPLTSLALDIGAACNGFIYGLKLTEMFLQQPNIKKVAVIGADIMSKLIDFHDRSTAVLFGDGAGAVIFEKTTEEIGFMSDDFGTDGSKGHLLYTDPCIKMSGQEVFANAVRNMSHSLRNSIQKAGLQKEQIDLLIPHQANIRIINSLQRQLGINDEQVVKTVAQHSNTSAASIPLALYQTHLDGRLAKAKHIAFCGIGAGLTWGSVIMKIR